MKPASLHLWARAFAALTLAFTACDAESQSGLALQDAGSFEPDAAFDAGLTLASAPSYVPPLLCASPSQDAVRDIFCADAGPGLSSLLELTQRLHFDPYKNSPEYESYDNDELDAGRVAPQASDASVVINLNVALLAHSTALSGRLVSPLNPRAIMLGDDTLIAFQRGIQQVELATRARDRDGLNMYLVSFRQACNEAIQGCRPGDLFTQRIESNWLSVDVQDDEQLKNTAQDCRQCHQRGLDRPLLLMRELDGPWTHFFGQDRDDVPAVATPEPLGSDLARDYRRAKGEESYAGLPINIIRGTIGLSLQERMNGLQPLLFDGLAIFNERFPQGPDGFLPAQPRSATWDAAYASFKRGERMALPYFKSRVSDEAKQAALADAYTRYRQGTSSADELPDLADIYPDDPQARAEIGLQTEPSATAPEALIQACGSCHNDVLDQSISRARFNIDLARMSQSERELAAERITRAPSEPGVMPPPDTRQLDGNALAQLRTYLSAPSRSVEDDALLQRAAELGMAMERGEVVNAQF